MREGPGDQRVPRPPLNPSQPPIFGPWSSEPLAPTATEFCTHSRDWGWGFGGGGKGSTLSPLPQYSYANMQNLRRFFAPPERWAADTVVLDREETHHLSRVLRLAAGARVVVCDGRGRAAVAVIGELGAAEAVLNLAEEVAFAAESPLQVTLGLALAKGEAMEQVVRQATEMGVQRLVPFVSTCSEKCAPERAARRLARWQRQAQESLKSCQRLYLPEISPIEDFSAVLMGPEEVKLLCYEGERGGGLLAGLKRPRPTAVRLLIGPEGGFTPGEVAQAREAGFQVVSLGPRRLRVKTAVLAALAILQYAWGDLG